MDDVILIDRDDNVTGTMDKIFAHKKGMLHRAVSVYIINDNGEILLQQRTTKNNKEQQRNTIQEASGVIPAVLILCPGKMSCLQQNAV